MLLIRNLKRSPGGEASPPCGHRKCAASTSGVSPLRVKLGLFALSAAIAGFGGIFYASFQRASTTRPRPATDGLLWLATVVLFGIRRPAAAAWAGIGSAATPVILQSGFHWWSWVPSWLSWNGTRREIPLILFGAGCIGLARIPDGFLSQTSVPDQRRERARRRGPPGRHHRRRNWWSRAREPRARRSARVRTAGLIGPADRHADTGPTSRGGRRGRGSGRAQCRGPPPRVEPGVFRGGPWARATWTPPPDCWTSGRSSGSPTATWRSSTGSSLPTRPGADHRAVWCERRRGVHPVHDGRGPGAGTEGSITLDGMDVTRMHAYRRCRPGRAGRAGVPWRVPRTLRRGELGVAARRRAPGRGL